MKKFGLIITFALVFFLSVSVLSACGKQVKFTATFLNDNGEVFSTQSIVKDNKVPKPTDPQPISLENDGLTFIGWFKDADLTDEWSFAGDKVTSDVTLYPKFASLGFLFPLKSSLNGASQSDINDPNKQSKVQSDLNFNAYTMYHDINSPLIVYNPYGTDASACFVSFTTISTNFGEPNATLTYSISVDGQIVKQETVKQDFDYDYTFTATGFVAGKVSTLALTVRDTDGTKINGAIYYLMVQ